MLSFDYSPCGTGPPGKNNYFALKITRICTTSAVKIDDEEVGLVAAKQPFATDRIGSRVRIDFRRIRIAEIWCVAASPASAALTWTQGVLIGNCLITVAGNRFGSPYAVTSSRADARTWPE